METLITLVNKIWEWLSCTFKDKYIYEEFDILSSTTKVYVKGYNAIYFHNAGEVTVLINGTFSIPPSQFFVSSNLPRQYFLADYQISFDTADTLGKNTGTTQRLEIIKKYEQGANYNQ